LDFIHTRICYGFLNENNHQEYSVLLVAVSLASLVPKIKFGVKILKI
jgi:hypothetical protein